MKKILFGTLALSLAVPAFAQELPVNGSVTLTYATRDVWRGLNLVDEAVLRGNISLNFNQFHAFVEGRMELTDTNSYPDLADPTGEITAVRSGLFYRFKRSKGVGLELGAMAHQYPKTGISETAEIYYGFNFGGPANFNLAVYQDIEEVKGYRVVANASSEIPAGLVIPGKGAKSITIFGSVAYGDNNYNSYYFGADTSTISDMSIGASMKIALSGFNLTPFIKYTAPVDPDIMAGFPNRTNFFGGVSLSMKF